MNCIPATNSEVKTVGRSIYFYQEIEPASVLSLREQLSTIICNTQAMAMSPQPAPITLHIHSLGGDILSSIAAMEAVRSCPVPVNCVVDGAAASAATLMAVTAKHRAIYKYAFMMIHQLSDSIWGTYDQLKDRFINAERFMDLLIEIYTKHTKLEADSIKSMMKHDRWFSADECLGYGLVDEII